MKNEMNTFLSEAAIRAHKEYLSELKHKASIYKKSGIDLKNALEGRGRNARISREEREKIKNLLLEIKMHEIYFESFGASFIPCQKVKEYFGSENNFAYLLSRFAEEMTGGFLCIYSDVRGRIGFCEARDLPSPAEVHLVIDMAEHAYFKDYGFKKGAYIRAALSHLDFSRINSFAEKERRDQT